MEKKEEEILTIKGGDFNAQTGKRGRGYRKKE